MKNKNLLLPIITLLCLLSVISMISAVTWITPTTGSYLTGSQNFNVSVTGLEDTMNCTFRTTAGVFAIVTNSSANQTYFNVTNNTALLTEVASTVLNVSCTNLSNSKASAVITIGIDNTAPTCSFSIDKTIVKINDVTGIVTTDASSDTTTLTHSWILYRDDNTQADTSSSTSPTFSETDFDQIGIFTLSQSVTDLVSKSTNCANQTITVRGSEDDISGAIASSTTTSNQTNKGFIIPIIIGVVILLVIIIMVVLIFVLNDGKKKR